MDVERVCQEIEQCSYSLHGAHAAKKEKATVTTEFSMPAKDFQPKDFPVNSILNKSM